MLFYLIIHSLEFLVVRIAPCYHPLFIFSIHLTLLKKVSHVSCGMSYLLDLFNLLFMMLINLFLFLLFPVSYNLVLDSFSTFGMNAL